MPRLARISIEGLLYYITSRAPQGQHLFEDDEDYCTYLELLRRTKSENHFKLFAYCLLPDHVHLLMELGNGANISEVMQNVNTAYTKYFSSRHQRKGHVFQGRFKATYVEKEAYLLELTRYIHLNPSKLHMTTVPGDFPYSSCSGYVNGRAQRPARTAPDVEREVLEVVSRLPGVDKRVGYREFLMGADEKKAAQIHKALHRGGFLGSDEFVGRVRKEIEARSKTADTEKREESARRGMERTGKIRKTFRIARAVGGRPVPAGGVAVAAGIIFLMVAAAGLYFYPGDWGRDTSSGTRSEDEYRMAMRERAIELRHKEVELERKEAELRKGGRRARPVGLGISKSLDGSVWTIYLRPQSAKDSTRGYEDKLIFQDGKVTSRRLASRGYPTTNYSLRVPDDETVVWETLQVVQNGASVTWRGDVRGRDMTGVMRRKSAKGDVETFSFVTRNLQAWL